MIFFPFLHSEATFITCSVIKAWSCSYKHRCGSLSCNHPHKNKRFNFFFLSSEFSYITCNIYYRIKSVLPVILFLLLSIIYKPQFKFLYVLLIIYLKAFFIIMSTIHHLNPHRVFVITNRLYDRLLRKYRINIIGPRIIILFLKYNYSK